MVIDHTKCAFSSGIHEGLTVGQGILNESGYWEIPCKECARNIEKRYPEYGPVWPFKDEKEESEKSLSL